ncbi:MAG: DUF1559 domain-containing protein, partial [Planctomycetota bacterium]
QDPTAVAWELKSGQTAAIAAYIGALRGSARQSQTMNDVKQVLLAFHNYYAAYNEFPKDIAPDGTPLLSWRVRILPYLNQSALYNTFDLKQPWNAAANKTSAATVVPTYSKVATGKSRVRIPLCKGSIWDMNDKITFDKMLDGTSNTIAVVIVPESSSANWSEPGYLQLDENDLVGSLFGDEDKLIAGFADGSVSVFSKSEMTEERLRAFLTFAGKELVKR